VNGQYADICSEGQHPCLEAVTYIHRYKTAALFQFTVRAGAILAKVSSFEMDHLSQFGLLLGMAFQVVDDVLDESSTSAVLGKTVGKDRTQQKATFPACIGLEASQSKAAQLINEAKAHLNQLECPQRFKSLLIIADVVIERLY
jgi:geranylgeranyl diphosphate synthase type II